MFYKTLTYQCMLLHSTVCALWFSKNLVMADSKTSSQTPGHHQTSCNDKLREVDSH